MLVGAFEVTVNEKQLGGTWMVLPKPGTTHKSPLWAATLTGYETPDYRYLNNQGKSLGGGDLGPDDGSFDDDSVQYRARHIFGAATADPPLTTITASGDRAGRAATELLIGRFTSKAPAPRVDHVSAHLTVRDSTGPARV